MIVALALMAFIMLLMLSLSTLVRIETATASQQLHKDTARQNALLGLNLALGQLQKLAGADTRITAPANIDNAVLGKGHWTGVWQSGSEGGANATDFEGWLVSLPTGVTNVYGESQSDNIDLVASNSNWVQIVGAGSVDNAAGADAVAVGRLPLDDYNHYAFWIGEENTKARINFPVPEAVDATDINLSAPRYTGFVNLDSAFEALEPNDARLKILTSLENLNNLASNSTVGTRYFHDLSLHARGIMTDAKNGGLKTDLTHLLENDAAFERYFGVSPTQSPIGNWDEPYAFRAYDNSYAFPYGSPNWGTLASYYRLYEDVDNGAFTATPPLPNVSGAAASAVSYYDADEIYHYNQPVHAVTSMLGLSVALEFQATLDTDNSGESITTYRPIIHYKPLIALYNPYDVKLNATQYNYNWEFKPTISITVGGQPTVTFNMQETLPESSAYGSLFRWRIENDTELLPGETRYYSLDQPYAVVDSTSNSDFAQMEADWNEDGAYYVDLTQSSHIVTALQNGNTASPYSHQSTRSTSSSAKSDRFGFTAEELDNLTVTLGDGESTGDINVQVQISYEPINVAGETYKSPHGAFYMRTGPIGDSNQASQLGDSYFQEYVDEMRPPEVNWSSPLTQLSAGPFTITAVEFSLRTTEDSHEAHRQLIDSNPRPIMMSGKEEGFRSGNGLSTYSGWIIRDYAPGAAPEPIVSDLDRFSSFWGNTRNISSGGALGGASVVLFHIPREPLISLGSFQHAGLSRYTRDPAYIFGNSYAISKIPSDQTESTYTEGSRTRYAYDWSYAINNAVWDSYFFSTIPQSADDAEEAIDDLNANVDTLPNSRFALHSPAGFELDNAGLATLLTDESATDTANLSAAFLFADGMFNVNSTSVDAWKAFLASNSHLAVPVYNPETQAIASHESESGAVFFRTPVSYDTGFATEENGQNFWNAYRRLTDAELTDLAQAVVDEVQTRGPFSSMGDFINRRPGSSDPEQRRRGALQAALDKSVNQRLSEDLIGSERGTALTTPTFATDVFNDEDAAGMGMPGWIMQGDLLQPLAPLMTVRSDTFRVRAYGDHANPLTGEIESQAWCEAIVQRIPDPVINTSTPTRSELANPPTEFGRQFRVIAFRWLNNDDV
ncbi:hypothetical protein [Cerasicoccus frondis]|uniref:hypothetical protein n=1 Tax=Cerasicoccus frondis TaxID=490090 RepID=UPI0028526577|nr:hypothetical protein [Cerasicoccus frondis]